MSRSLLMGIAAVAWAIAAALNFIEAGYEVSLEVKTDLALMLLSALHVEAA